MFENLVRKKTLPVVKVTTQPDDVDASMEFLGSLFKSKEQRELDKIHKARSNLLNLIFEQEKRSKNLIPKAYVKITAFKKSFDRIESEIKGKKINSKKFENCSFNYHSFLITWADGKNCLEEMFSFVQEIRFAIKLPIIKNEENINDRKNITDTTESKLKDIESVFDDVLQEEHQTEEEGLLYFKKAGYPENFVSILLSHKQNIMDIMLELPKLHLEFDSLLQSYKNAISEINSIEVFDVIKGILTEIGNILEYTHPQEIIYFLISYAMHISKNCYE